MRKEDIKTDADFEAFIAEKEKEFSALIDKWIVDGPTYKQERLLSLGEKLLASENITSDEFELIKDCATSVPKAGDGMINLSFALESAKNDAEFKGYVAKVMAMMSLLGHLD